MSRTVVIVVAAVLAACAAFALRVESQSSAPASTVVLPADVKWEAAKSLPAGIVQCPLHGDPAKGPSVALVKVPAGTLIPPHRHSAEEVAVVQSGTMLFGSGETVDEAAATPIGVGGYVRISTGSPHWAKAKTEVVFVRYAAGPADVTYCDPANDPRKKN